MYCLISTLVYLLLITVANSQNKEEYPDFVKHVNILGGTHSRFDYSTGSLLPFVGRPWGMNNWAVQTNNYAGAKLGPLTHWWFHPEDREFYGFRLTHQASPWIYDYGELLFTPSVGTLKSSWPDKASAYNRSSASFTPYEINVTLESYCTGKENMKKCLTAAITATERAAVLKMKFPVEDSSSSWNQTRHLRLLIGRNAAGFTDSVNIDISTSTVSGYTRANSGGVPTKLVAVADDVLERAGRYLYHSLVNENSMYISYSLRFDGYDISTFAISHMEDPVTVCAEACGAHSNCQAFSIDFRRRHDNFEGLINVCVLKTAAVIQFDRSDKHSFCIVGWKNGVVPQVYQPLFAHYFHLEFDVNISQSVVNKIVDDAMYVDGLEAVLSFALSVNEINVRIATSFISETQARLNLEREIPKKSSYEEVREGTHQLWNKLLSKTQLLDPGNVTVIEGLNSLVTWYSNIYRTSIYPRMLFEYDEKGNPIHYSPNDPEGRVFQGRLSSDSGFWDAYRTVYPLNSVIRADQMAIQMEGWLNAYKESGHLPSWASPGDRGAMTGNMQDASVADAIVKDIKGFNKSLAFKAIMDDAYNVSMPYHKASGRRKGLGEYKRLGYIPTGLGIGDEVSATLNYALADYSMSLAAKKVGDTKSATELKVRSQNAWRMLWDGEYKGGFFRPKNADGKWISNFDEFAWEGDSGEYTEASAWQYRFYVPHEPGALADAYKDGGGTMCKYLIATMTGSESGATFHNGHWGLHHEQTEMVENCFGQYEHNNQPVWHMLYMFAPAGCSNEGQFWLRQAMSRFYGPEYFCGDEDNGSMASWYLLSAMGIYQLVPGNTTYQIGSPLHRSIVLHLDNGRVLSIKAKGNVPSTPYVRSVSYNGTKLKSLTIEYDQLRSGGILEFSMGSEPCIVGKWPCG